MATFKITEKTTVAQLKEQFGNEVGGTLRIYEGRSEAANDVTLVSLGAKEGELECRTSRTVGSFEKALQDELNLKVKVYTKDNWVAVLDSITLSSVKDIPKNSTKASMEEFWGYKNIFRITAQTTVAELKEQFNTEIGGILHIYDGRNEAADDTVLVSLGANEGTVKYGLNRSVGKFIEAVQNDLNLKVRVFTSDNWVAVLDGITLSSVKDIPNYSTKASMEKYLGYKKEEEA